MRSNTGSTAFINQSRQGAAHADISHLQPNSSAVIAPIDSGAPTPLVSVVLPVYEPGQFLIDALRSVLKQDLGERRMQIAVVDDASLTCDVATLVADAAPPGRVELYRATNTQGLAGNWNQCIRVARGQIVHILHQDDWVDDGFYRRLLPAFDANPRIGMAFCRHAIVEERERVKRVSHREAWRAGVLSGWLGKIAEKQRIQCASALVRRSVYEQLGGYRSDLCYALDWEMWVRIAARFEVWYEPKKLAYYRRHCESETARLGETNRLDIDLLKAIDIFSHYLPAVGKEQLLCAAYYQFATKALKKFRKAASAQSWDMTEALGFLRTAVGAMTGASRQRLRLNETLAELERVSLRRP